RKLLDRGGLIAGTSAGAAVMSETMLVEGESDDTPDVAQIVQMAPGLGFLGSAIVDMHFAERGRLGRLLGAIAQNPRMLGIGIDEDTAMIVHGDCLEVMGSGGVYILDGSKSRRSNVAEAAADETLAIENVTLHLLSAHRQYDLEQRQPA
ncbi:MAG TPA: cyanophycinase, partial [Candidatus Limnocylindrales bacterium]|nr:cyanophycinase [Candidatus Limnocylindrales bacterium]